MWRSMITVNALEVFVAGGDGLLTSHLGAKGVPVRRPVEVDSVLPVLLRRRDHEDRLT